MTIIGAPAMLLRLRRGTLPDRKVCAQAAQAGLRSAGSCCRRLAVFLYGALFALGSGSKPNRRSAVLLALNVDGSTQGPPRAISLQNWFKRLRREFGEVNLEGAFIEARKPVVAAAG